MKKIGMRNIKTAIAVFLCIVILRAFNVSSPFYACIAAIITMEKTIYNSFTVGKNRIIGTTMGALIGMIFALIMPGNPFLIAIGISLVIYLCNILKYNKSLTIGCIVFVAIMINLKNVSPIQYSINRLAETLIGIIIAVIVNFVIAPPDLVKSIHASYKKIYEDIILLCGENFYEDNSETLSDLNKHIKELDSSMKFYKEEFPNLNTHKIYIENFEKDLNSFYKLYFHVSIIQDMKYNESLTENNIKKLKELTNVVYKNMKIENKEVNLVFNYHIDEITTILKSLKEKGLYLYE